LALHARRHLDASLLDMERQPSRLRIETIDAFNAWLAGQLPIAAGAGSAFQVLADASHCYQEAARRALARETDDQFGVAVDRVLALDDQRWKSLLKLIAAMLPGRDRWLPLLAGRLQAASALDEHQLERVRQQLDEDLQLLVSRALSRACDALGGERIAALSALVREPRGACPRSGGNWPRGWRMMPLRAASADLARWHGAAWLLLTAANEFRKRLTKNEGFRRNARTPRG
jgi:ATP-dependent exoDNAse (exonuclease V) beta subunit